jgi:F0F1-type ATP synthase membrane subunit b/b'
MERETIGFFIMLTFIIAWPVYSELAAVLKKRNDRAIAKAEAKKQSVRLIKQLETEINKTPSGYLRNLLTDVNITIQNLTE